MRYYEIILESQNYENMFSNPVFDDNRDYINAIIKLTKNVFKKNDRIVWFLRLFRLNLLANKNMDQKILQKYESEYEKLSGPIPYDSISNITRVLNSLEHFLSLPVPEIQNTVFSNQNPEELLLQFQNYEKKWQHQENKDAIYDEEGLKPLISFNNGFGWYNLNKAYCSKEAKAMGHCGNEPRKNTKDTIFSLRKEIKKGGKKFYIPYLTFILLDDGTLGEMKGRFNNSPKHAYENGYAPSDFNNEIVALLKMPLIKGITGGGYMPEENFKITDLSKQQIEDLGKIKPRLLPLSYRYKREGVTSELIEDIKQYTLNNYGIYKDYDVEEQAFVWDYEKNLRSFIANHVTNTYSRSNISIVAEWALDVLDGDYEFNNITDKSLEKDLIDNLDQQTSEKLKVYVSKYSYDKSNDLFEIIDEMGDRIIRDILYDAVNEGIKIGKTNSIYETFTNWLDELKTKDDLWIVLPKWNEKSFKSDVLVLMSIQKMLSLIDDNEDIRYLTYDFEDMPDYDFDSYDETAAMNYFINAVNQIIE